MTVPTGRFRGNAATVDRQTISLRGSPGTNLNETAAESAIPTPKDHRVDADAIRACPGSLDESTAPTMQPDIADTDRVIWQPVFAIHADGRYHVRDFLPIHDRAFVIAAFRAVLRREPDSAGLEAYLAHLRRGMSKAEILSCLHYSPEGRIAGTHVAGLRLQNATHKIGQWPLIGPWVRHLVVLWNLPETERERRAFENALIARVEQAQFASIKSLRNINRSFRVLSKDQEATKQTAAAKADRDAVDHVHAALEILKSKISGIEVLTVCKAEKRDVEDLFQSIRGLLQTLQSDKADRVELAEMKSVKADKSELVQIDSLKADRAELEEVRSTKADKEEVAQVQSRKADKVALDEIHARLCDLRRSLGELGDAGEEVIRALEAKSDRREVTALTSSLLTLAQAQVDKDDFAALAQSIREELERQVKELKQSALSSSKSSGSGTS